LEKHVTNVEHVMYIIPIVFFSSFEILV